MSYHDELDDLHADILLELYRRHLKSDERALMIRHYLEEVARSGQMDFFSESGPISRESVPEPVILGQQRRFDFENGFEQPMLTDDTAQDRLCSRWGIND